MRRLRGRGEAGKEGYSRIVTRMVRGGVVELTMTVQRQRSVHSAHDFQPVPQRLAYIRSEYDSSSHVL